MSSTNARPKTPQGGRPVSASSSAKRPTSASASGKALLQTAAPNAPTSTGSSSATPSKQAFAAMAKPFAFDFSGLTNSVNSVVTKTTTTTTTTTTTSSLSSPQSTDTASDKLTSFPFLSISNASSSSSSLPPLAAALPANGAMHLFSSTTPAPLVPPPVLSPTAFRNPSPRFNFNFSLPLPHSPTGAADYEFRVRVSSTPTQTLSSSSFAPILSVDFAGPTQSTAADLPGLASSASMRTLLSSAGTGSVDRVSTLFPVAAESFVSSAQNLYALDAEWMRRLIIAGCQTVINHRQLLDRLNGRSHCEGNTGANLAWCTAGILKAASQFDCTSATAATSLGALVDTILEAALLNSRGLSSALFVCFFEHLRRSFAGARMLSTAQVADALRQVGAAMQTAFGIGSTQSASMATVAYEASLALAPYGSAIVAGKAPASLLSLLVSWRNGARIALARTSADSAASAVDAGAQGFVLLLEGMCESAAGNAVLSLPVNSAHSAVQSVARCPRPDFRFIVEFVLETRSAATSSTLETRFTSVGRTVCAISAGATGRLAVVCVHTNAPEQVFSIASAIGNIRRRRVVDQSHPSHESGASDAGDAGAPITRAAAFDLNPRIRIVFDSMADTPSARATRLGAQTVASRVRLASNTEYRELVDIQHDEFLALLAAADDADSANRGAVAGSAAAALGVAADDWVFAIQRALRSMPADGELLCMTSSRLLAPDTWNALQSAIRTISSRDSTAAARIFAFDTQVVGQAAALLVEKASELAHSAFNAPPGEQRDRPRPPRAAELLLELTRMRARTSIVIVPPPSMRVDASSMLAASTSCGCFGLDAHQVFALSNGAFFSADRCWSSHAARESAVQTLVASIPRGARARVSVMHSGRPDLIDSVKHDILFALTAKGASLVPFEFELASARSALTQHINLMRSVCIGPSLSIEFGYGTWGAAVLWEVASPNPVATVQSPPVTQESCASSSLQPITSTDTLSLPIQSVESAQTIASPQSAAAVSLSSAVKDSSTQQSDDQASVADTSASVVAASSSAALGASTPAIEHGSATDVSAPLAAVAAEASIVASAETAPRPSVYFQNNGAAVSSAILNRMSELSLNDEYVTKPHVDVSTAALAALLAEAPSAANVSGNEQQTVESAVDSQSANKRLGDSVLDKMSEPTLHDGHVSAPSANSSPPFADVSVVNEEFAPAAEESSKIVNAAAAESGQPAMSVPDARRADDATTSRAHVQIAHVAPKSTSSAFCCGDNQDIVELIKSSDPIAPLATAVSFPATSGAQFEADAKVASEEKAASEAIRENSVKFDESPGAHAQNPLASSVLIANAEQAQSSFAAVPETHANAVVVAAVDSAAAIPPVPVECPLPASAADLVVLPASSLPPASADAPAAAALASVSASVAVVVDAATFDLGVSIPKSIVESHSVNEGPANAVIAKTIDNSANQPRPHVSQSKSSAFCCGNDDDIIEPSQRASMPAPMVVAEAEDAKIRTEAMAAFEAAPSREPLSAIDESHDAHAQQSFTSSAFKAAESSFGVSEAITASCTAAGPSTILSTHDSSATSAVSETEVSACAPAPVAEPVERPINDIVAASAPHSVVSGQPSVPDPSASIVEARIALPVPIALTDSELLASSPGDGLSASFPKSARILVSNEVLAPSAADGSLAIANEKAGAVVAAIVPAAAIDEYRAQSSPALSKSNSSAFCCGSDDDVTVPTRHAPVPAPPVAAEVSAAKDMTIAKVASEASREQMIDAVAKIGESHDAHSQVTFASSVLMSNAECSNLAAGESRGPNVAATVHVAATV